MKSVVQDAPIREKPDPGDVVVCQLKAVKESEPIKIRKGPRAGETFTKLHWKFTVIEGQFEDLDLYGDTSSELSNHPDNTYRLWAEALLGQPLWAGVGLDTDDLLGLICDVVVKGEPYQKNGEDRLAIKVGDVLKHDFDSQPTF